MIGSEWLELIQKMTCTVIGLGVSNLPLIDYLLFHGATVTARDQKTRAQMEQTADALEAKGVRLFWGDHYLDALDEDIIFRSPGVHPHTPQLLQAVERGAILTSEMELFLDLTPARVFAVTGSDGKTTTTTVTHLMLREQSALDGGGRVYVGGNIGEPLLPHVDEMTDADVAVVELSSFQLYTVQRSPEYAAVTNLSPNHLNWHCDMQDYIDAKTNIYTHAPNQAVVFNAENEITLDLAKRHTGKMTLFSSKKHCATLFEGLLKDGDRAVYVREDGMIVLWNGDAEIPYFCAEEILLPGNHNLENYLTAIALTDGAVSPEAARAVAVHFRGVAHRLELVREVDGVTYYNSSIDTSPTRTAAALSALKQKPIVICGGYDKHIPFAPLAKALCERAKAVVLTGATARSIGDALQAADCRLAIHRADDFTDAVLLAKSIAREGDTVLLSPACASFDAFRNFAERGDRFREIVMNFSEKEK